MSNLSDNNPQKQLQPVLPESTTKWQILKFAIIGFLAFDLLFIIAIFLNIWGVWGIFFSGGFLGISANSSMIFREDLDLMVSAILLWLLFVLAWSLARSLVGIFHKTAVSKPILAIYSAFPAVIIALLIYLEKMNVSMVFLLAGVLYIIFWVLFLLDKHYP